LVLIICNYIKVEFGTHLKEIVLKQLYWRNRLQCIIHYNFFSNQAIFLPDMNYFLISSLNNQIQINDLIEEEEVIKYTGHANSTHLVDLCLIKDPSDESYLISGSEDGCIYYWNIQESEGQKVKINTLTDNQIINCISTNNNGILACSGYPNDDNNIYLYNYDFNL
jgi:WD40 repeat protein